MSDDDILQNNACFSTLAPEEHDILVAGRGIWKDRSFPMGTVIFSEGDRSTDLYLIIRGQVEITKKVGTDGLRKKVLALLPAGGIFGEGSLLSDRPRSATVTALEDLEVMVVTKEDFNRFLKDKPSQAILLLFGLLKVVNHRLIWTNHELVTLYDVAHMVSENKEDIPGLVQGLAEKLESATQIPRGIIALRNLLTQTLEVSAAWGGLSLSKEILEQGLIDNGSRVWSLVGNRLFLPIRDMEGKCWGVIVMEQDGTWILEQRKVAQTIAEQLGVAIADYHFIQSEAGRSKLRQQNIQF